MGSIVTSWCLKKLLEYHKRFLKIDMVSVKVDVMFGTSGGIMNSMLFK